MRTNINLKGPSLADQIAYSQPDPAFEKYEAYRAALADLAAIIGQEEAEAWRKANLTLNQSLTEWTDLTRAEVIIRRGMAHECNHFLPEQVCQYCDPVAIRGDDPNEIPF